MPAMGAWRDNSSLSDDPNTRAYLDAGRLHERSDVIVAERRARPEVSPFGRVLRDWRHKRGLSQLDLALAADGSQRHISFLESGRAQPSRDMVLRLATMLDLPLRERDVMLVAAGFAPIYRARELADPELQPVRKALDFM